jgi:hypothetical protein
MTGGSPLAFGKATQGCASKCTGLSKACILDVTAGIACLLIIGLLLGSNPPCARILKESRPKPGSFPPGDRFIGNRAGGGRTLLPYLYGPSVSMSIVSPPIQITGSEPFAGISPGFA